MSAANEFFCVACLSPVTTEAASVLLLPDRIRKSCSHKSQTSQLKSKAVCMHYHGPAEHEAGRFTVHAPSIPAAHNVSTFNTLPNSITATNILHTLSSVSVSSAFPGVCIIRLKRPNASCNRLTFLTCSSHTHSTSRQAHQHICLACTQGATVATSTKCAESRGCQCCSAACRSDSCCYQSLLKVADNTLKQVPVNLSDQDLLSAHCYLAQGDHHR